VAVVQSASDQIRDRVGDDNGVLGSPSVRPTGALAPSAVGDDDRLVGDVSPSIISTAAYNPLRSPASSSASAASRP
jgi:hypothetical protein